MILRELFGSKNLFPSPSPNTFTLTLAYHFEREFVPVQRCVMQRAVPLVVKLARIRFRSEKMLNDSDWAKNI